MLRRLPDIERSCNSAGPPHGQGVNIVTSDDASPPREWFHSCNNSSKRDLKCAATPFHGGWHTHFFDPHGTNLLPILEEARRTCKVMFPRLQYTRKAHNNCRTKNVQLISRQLWRQLRQQQLQYHSCTEAFCRLFRIMASLESEGKQQSISFVRKT